MLRTSTYFSLLAEFGTAQLPLEAVCWKFFRLSFPEARRRAAFHQLPVPAFRGGSQKSEWLIDAADLAAHIDKTAEKAREEWQALNRVRAS